MCYAVPLWLSPVKQLIRNQQIMGSNPISGSLKRPRTNVVCWGGFLNLHDRKFDFSRVRSQGVVSPRGAGVVLKVLLIRAGADYPGFWISGKPEFRADTTQRDSPVLKKALYKMISQPHCGL